MSELQRVKISALGTYVPPRVLTNADLAKMVDTNDAGENGKVSGGRSQVSGNTPITLE